MDPLAPQHEYPPVHTAPPWPLPHPNPAMGNTDVLLTETALEEAGVAEVVRVGVVLVPWMFMEVDLALGVSVQPLWQPEEIRQLHFH